MICLARRLRCPCCRRCHPRLGLVAASDLQLRQEHVAIVRRTDDDGSAGTGLKHPDATQDEGAHDALAELGFGNEQGTQAFPRDYEHFGGLAILVALSILLRACLILDGGLDVAGNFHRTGCSCVAARRAKI